jgi:hypothetical protein
MGKAAQEALLLSLAEEFKGTNLTANVIQVNSIDLEGAGNPGQSVRGKGTSPEEIAAAMLYLCSDDARKLNGASACRYFKFVIYATERPLRQAHIVPMSFGRRQCQTPERHLHRTAFRAKRGRPFTSRSGVTKRDISN